MTALDTNIDADYSILNSIVELINQGDLNRESALNFLELLAGSKTTSLASWIESEHFCEKDFSKIGISKLDIIEFFFEPPLNFSEVLPNIVFFSSDGNHALSDREQFQVLKEYFTGECKTILSSDGKIDFSFKVEPFPGKIMTMYTDRHSEGSHLGTAYPSFDAFFLKKSDYSKELLLRVFFEEAFHLIEDINSSEYYVKLWREAKMKELGIKPMTAEEVLEEVLTNYTEKGRTYIQKSLKSAFMHTEAINLEKVLSRLADRGITGIAKQLREGIELGNERRESIGLDSITISEELLSKFS